MEHLGVSRDANTNKNIIGRATSAEEIIDALARRGCSNLTSLIVLSACSDLPCAGGGFCDVYRGMLRDGTRIAIKVLRVYDRPGGDSDREKIFKRAARELYHWSKLKHPNVLPLMGLTVFRGHISMISEWMENGCLMSYLRLVPDANRIRLCMDICVGLCYLHANNMVHGDLKAANIMVSSEGNPLIADFGNAELRDFTLKFTNTTKCSISVRWTAPELLLADTSPRVSKEADVYAYGMTALEIITGKVPFEGINDNRVICLVAYEGKIPPRPDIDIQDDIWSLLTWCWARKPAKRPRITNVNDRFRSLFRPSFDTWSIEAAASQLPGLGTAEDDKEANEGAVRPSITRLFDRSHKPERNPNSASGGRFILHKLLHTDAFRTDAPHIKFDILHPKEVSLIGGGDTRVSRVLDEPATSPAISKLRILVVDLPWIIRVHNIDGVTLRDIVDTTAAFFHQEMNPREWSMLDGAHKMAARRSFALQSYGNVTSGSLRRFECLVGTTMFMGMDKNDALVRRQAGDEGVEWTWVMFGPR